MRLEVEDMLHGDLKFAFVVFIAAALLLVPAQAGTSSEASCAGASDDSLCKIMPGLLGMSGVVDMKAVCENGDDLGDLAQELRSVGIREVAIGPRGSNSVLFTHDTSVIPRIAGIGCVVSIEEVFQPVLLMDNITSAGYMGHDIAQAIGFNGTGILVEIQDNGVEVSHPDLDRILFTDGSVTPQAHGTCTSGIMLGDGGGSMAAQGIAFRATGVACDFHHGRYSSIQDLWNGNFNEGTAGMNGVIQSNSWYEGVNDGEYLANTNEIDRAARDFPNVLSFWGAGNTFDGTDPGQISEDGVAKNVVCVGGVFHNDSSWTGDDKWMLKNTGSCASRGPAADGRQKPDLCGPFDLILTVDQQGAAGYVPGDYFSNFGGTSGATPNVAGSGTLVYQMYREDFFGNNPAGSWPRSCTAKAILVADAQQYSLTRATRNEQGWGTPDLENTCALGADRHVIVEYPQPLGSGQTWTSSIYSDGTAPLKVTLAWIDPAAPSNTRAGRALINNLDLKITSPGGAIYYGNNGLWDGLFSASGTGANHWSTTAGYLDDLNNVENVFIQEPQVGRWTVEVTGRAGDVAQGPQDFSLVASGARAQPASAGFVEISEAACVPGDSVTVEVWDSDLNANPVLAETATVQMTSAGEPAGESFSLTEISANSGIFTASVPTGPVDSPGLICVNALDTVNATYSDGNHGGAPQAMWDECAVDGAAPAQPAPLSVDRWGDVSNREVAVAATYTLGFVTNDANQTWTQDDVRNFIEESASGKGMNLDLAYTFRLNADSAAPYSLRLDAHTTGESFSVRCSVNGGAYTTLGSVTATSDTDSYYQWAITASPLSSVAVQFIGTVTSSEAMDTLHIDHMYIQGAPILNPQDQNTLNWTLSADDGAGADDVAHYNIYRSSSSSGPWDAAALVTTVGAGRSTFTDRGRGLSDGITWWYVVRAEDAWGNEETNTDAVPEVEVGTGPYSISLIGIAANSWAMVSFPSGVTGNIQDILDDASSGDGGTTWSVAKWYNPQTPADPWKTYRVGGTANDMPVINNTMGFWLYLTANGGDQALTLRIYASIPEVTNINLYAGWNLVGYPSTTNRLGTLTPAAVDIISAYSGSATYTDYTNKASIFLHHGNAYFMHCTANAVWTVLET